MYLNHISNKNTGDTVTATEWNHLASDVNELGAGGSSQGSQDSQYMYINDKGNLCIETTVENVPAGKKGKINIESKDDLQLKPGDDIILYSNHRPIENLDEVSVKVTDGEDNPVKLQVNTADIVLTTKDKGKTRKKDSSGADITATSIVNGVDQNAMYTDPSVMNITVNSAKNTRGYLKVRAQAIDLRSESHGGIALQPKGYDGDSTPHMNKIKFEHGGGDGLEFGTFNTEKSSLFTDEYRFNKNGVLKLATRETETSDKYDINDETTHYKYVKQNDDFYDVINQNDPTCTWEDIIKFIAWAKTNKSGKDWASIWTD